MKPWNWQGLTKIKFFFLVAKELHSKTHGPSMHTGLFFPTESYLGN